MDNYKCPHQGCSNNENIPSHEDKCPGCGRSIETPNVRKALTEEGDLVNRYQDAKNLCETTGSLDQLENFVAQIKEKSEACINRATNTLRRLIVDKEPYKTFYQNRNNGMPFNEDNYNTSRASIDNMFFTHYHEKVVFAALTLNGEGLPHYGQHTLILNTAMIDHRATAFTENSFVFVDKHSLTPTSPIPPGHRSTWDNRGILAGAKYSEKITSSTKEEEFPSILLNYSRVGDETADEFIEIHIYGHFNLSAIKTLTIKKSKDKGQNIIIDSIVDVAESSGINVVTTSADDAKAA